MGKLRTGGDKFPVPLQEAVPEAGLRLFFFCFFFFRLRKSVGWLTERQKG